jgi:hypothetical protein
MCPVSAWHGTQDVAGLCKTPAAGPAEAGAHGSGWTGPGFFPHGPEVVVTLIEAGADPNAPVEGSLLTPPE